MNKTEAENITTKGEIIEKWQELIEAMEEYLEYTKQAGGTMSHKVGSIKSQLMKSKENFNNL